MHFFLGTTNTDKIREIGAILSATGCTYTPSYPVDPYETEPDFEGNAKLKAIAYAQHSKGMTISEDSGIIVPALSNLPGPWSARFSEYSNIDPERGVVVDHHTSNLTRADLDRRNNALLIELLRGVPQPYRGAMFKVVLCVASAEGKILFSATGESHGWIAEEPRGEEGFGYDPIFVGNDTFGKTYGELDSMRKNLRSHRQKVLQDFQAWLAHVLKEEQPT